MPIYELLKTQGTFEPEEVAMLGSVFEEVLQTLGLVDRQDLATEMVAKKLIELAKAGVRDPDRLKALTVQAFTQQQQQRQPIQRKRG
jgi:hypothetical protein